MRFFFDNQLSPHLAKSIHALTAADGGHVVVHCREKYRPSTSDSDWIQALAAERDWIIVSGDLNIIRTRAERPIWRGSGLIGFFLKKGWMNQTPWEQAWRLVRWWPDIVKQAQIAAPGATYAVQLAWTGKFETL